MVKRHARLRDHHLLFESTDAGFEDLLVFLQQSRGFDFGGYKRESLVRRVSRRLEHLGIASFADHKDFLEVHPGEFTLLFNTILINVTSFFRDAEAWDYLARAVCRGCSSASRGAAVHQRGAAHAQRLRTVIRPCLAGEVDRQEVQLDAINRGGK